VIEARLGSKLFFEGEHEIWVDAITIVLSDILPRWTLDVDLRGLGRRAQGSRRRNLILLR
jgi:hypothetical protein